MMREYQRSRQLDGFGDFIGNHALGVTPDFVHILPLSVCTEFPYLFDWDATQIMLRGGTPNLLFDMLIIKDHSLIR